MKYIIVGGGNSVYYLSRSLTSKGHHVTIINRNHDECMHLARKLKAVIINGDASNKKILEQAGASSANAIFVITLNDHDNLVICQLAQTIFDNLVKRQNWLNSKNTLTIIDFTEIG